MKRKYSIIIIPPEHNQSPRQFNFSPKAKRIIIAVAGVLLVFFASLFIHTRYQMHYINEYRQKIAYMDKLEAEIEANNQEIDRLHEKTEEINNHLSAIAALEKKIAKILNIQPQNNTQTNSSENR
ncbi:MAG: hypothetical protein GX091_10520 [Peptococcaceae bacterium]|nr:hypothetical protein [Peptococcaceae bacterium]